jgi:hypothetical protein
VTGLLLGFLFVADDFLVRLALSFGVSYVCVPLLTLWLTTLCLAVAAQAILASVAGYCALRRDVCRFYAIHVIA